MLTRRQKDALEAIRAHAVAYGTVPTRRELARAMGLNSASGAHRLLWGLEARGFIRMAPHRARGYEEVVRGGADVMAERERCARLVELFFSKTPSHLSTVSALLEAIRAGREPRAAPPFPPDGKSSN